MLELSTGAVMDSYHVIWEFGTLLPDYGSSRCAFQEHQVLVECFKYQCYGSIAMNGSEKQSKTGGFSYFHVEHVGLCGYGSIAITFF
jgi:hypothetical protein